MKSRDGALSSRQRFAARARAARLRSWRPLLIALGGFGVVVVLAWVVLSSRLLAVHSVAVQGTHRVSSDQVRAAVAAAEGHPLLRADLSALSHRVEAIPGVRRAVVTRHWPSTLEVTVTERKPLAAVHRADGWWLVDEDGVEYGPPTATEPAGLHTVTLPPQGQDSAAATSAAHVIRALPAPLLAQVSQVDATSADDVRLKLRTGATVVWGSDERAAEKARILTTLIAKRARVYDVSSPSVVTTR